MKRKAESNPKNRAGSSPGRRRLPRTFLGVKRRFIAIVRSAAQEVDELKTLLHPSIDGIVESPPSPTPETHLLASIREARAHLNGLTPSLAQNPARPAMG